jgi:DNA invertase Pin-like site-specific DNA recombinase
MAATLTAAVRQTNVERSPTKCPATLDFGWQSGQDNFRTGKRTPVSLAHIGYARVSTIDQDPALQLDALTSAGCTKVFEDRVSGTRTDRVGLRSALDYVRDGDVLIVWKLDRLGRSLPHLIETVTVLEKRGVGFRSITETIDTTTPGGRLVFHLFGALGQFERDLIQERTRAGLAAAAARGRTGGRKPVVTDDKFKRARLMIERGLTVRDAAVRLRIGKTALYDAFRRHGNIAEPIADDALLA